MKRHGLIWIVVLLAAVAMAQAANGPAGRQAPQASDVQILDIDACYDEDNFNTVKITFSALGTTDDGGYMDQICVEIWDDQVMVAITTSSVPVGVTRTNLAVATWQGPIGPAAQGIGIYMEDCPQGGELAVEDPVDLVPCGEIPTLTEWGFIAAALLLGLFAWRRLAAQAA